MSTKNLVKRADIEKINSPAPWLKWDKWFEGYMMRGDSEKISYLGDVYTLEVFHVGNNWSKHVKVFWVLREKRLFYEMSVDSLNWKGEKRFLLPWDLIEITKEKVLEDLRMREKLKGSVI